MTNLSASRIRRRSDRAAESQQQFITFTIRNVGFLLPIAAVYRAVAFEVPPAAPGGSPLPIEQIRFEEQVLAVLNVDQQLFNRRDRQPQASQQVALIVETGQGKLGQGLGQGLGHALTGELNDEWNDSGEFHGSDRLIALPIDSAPSLCRIPTSSLVPLPKTYQVNCVMGMTDNSADPPLRFLLNATQLHPSEASAGADVPAKDSPLPEAIALVGSNPSKPRPA